MIGLQKLLTNGSINSSYSHLGNFNIELDVP